LAAHAGADPCPCGYRYDAGHARRHMCDPMSNPEPPVDAIVGGGGWTGSIIGKEMAAAFSPAAIRSKRRGKAHTPIHHCGFPMRPRCLARRQRAWVITALATAHTLTAKARQTLRSALVTRCVTLGSCWAGSALLDWPGFVCRVPPGSAPEVGSFPVEREERCTRRFLVCHFALPDTLLSRVRPSGISAWTRRGGDTSADSKCQPKAYSGIAPQQLTRADEVHIHAGGPID
jgi:hypothetical protein